MAEKIVLGDIVVDLIRKDIKNVHLSVYPPTGAVRISAPNYMSLDSIRAFAISKLAWIKRVQGPGEGNAQRVPRSRESLRLGQSSLTRGGGGKCRPLC